MANATRASSSPTTTATTARRFAANCRPATRACTKKSSSVMGVPSSSRGPQTSASGVTTAVVSGDMPMTTRASRAPKMPTTTNSATVCTATLIESQKHAQRAAERTTTRKDIDGTAARSRAQIAAKAASADTSAQRKSKHFLRGAFLTSLRSDMKTITATDFRSAPGERLIDVRREGASFLITKSGKPIARLLPVDDAGTIERNGRIRGEAPLTMHRELGQGY